MTGRTNKIVAAMAVSGMTDVTAHFTPIRRYRGTENWTWKMRLEGRTVTGREDYILGSDRYDFIKARIREDRIHKDHQMVLAVI